MSVLLLRMLMLLCMLILLRMLLLLLLLLRMLLLLLLLLLCMLRRSRSRWRAPGSMRRRRIHAPTVPPSRGAAAGPPARAPGLAASVQP